MSIISYGYMTLSSSLSSFFNVHFHFSAFLSSYSFIWFLYSSVPSVLSSYQHDVHCLPHLFNHLPPLISLCIPLSPLYLPIHIFKYIISNSSTRSSYPFNFISNPSVHSTYLFDFISSSPSTYPKHLFNYIISIPSTQSTSASPLSSIALSSRIKSLPIIQLEPLGLFFAISS